MSDYTPTAPGADNQPLHLGDKVTDCISGYVGRITVIRHYYGGSPIVVIEARTGSAEDSSVAVDSGRLSKVDREELGGEYR